MRLVSLAPSATRIITQLGHGDQLVGVTQHCPVTDVETVGGWVTPSYDKIDALNPDYVYTTDTLQREIRDELEDRGHNVWYAEPTDLDAVLRTFESISETLGASRAGALLREVCETRLQCIQRTVPWESPPTVYCEEWVDPMMVAGNWVPELVDIAGGQYRLHAAGERSREITVAEVAAENPDYIVFNVCGHGTQVQVDSVKHRDWEVDSEFVVVDDTLLNEPSPVLVDGAAYLAELFHGNPPWVRDRVVGTPPF